MTRKVLKCTMYNILGNIKLGVTAPNALTGVFARPQYELTHDPEDGLSLEGTCVNLLAFNIGGHCVLSNKIKA
jgi:hypothetical protein